MAQYAHLSEMDAEISAAVAQMPELPPFDNIAVTRQFIEKLLGVSRAAREAALPPSTFNLCGM